MGRCAQLFGRNLGSCLYELRCEGLYVGAQFVEVLCVFGDEFVIEEIFVQDDADHASEYGRVLPRDGL